MALIKIRDGITPDLVCRAKATSDRRASTFRLSEALNGRKKILWDKIGERLSTGISLRGRDESRAPMGREMRGGKIPRLLPAGGLA